MFQVKKANKEDYILVRDFYYELIDAMEHAEFSPGWERDIYPAQEYLIESIECDELYIGEIDGEMVSCMVINHAYNEGYKNIQWSVEAKDSKCFTKIQDGQTLNCLSILFDQEQIFRSVYMKNLLYLNHKFLYKEGFYETGFKY